MSQTLERYRLYSRRVGICVDHVRFSHALWLWHSLAQLRTVTKTSGSSADTEIGISSVYLCDFKLITRSIGLVTEDLSLAPQTHILHQISYASRDHGPDIGLCSLMLELRHAIDTWLAAGLLFVELDM